jgi:hypothetical protein
MAKKEIVRSVSEDFEISEDGKKVGTLRVKPNGILWKDKGQHSWKKLTIEQISDLARKHGVDQDK